FFGNAGVATQISTFTGFPAGVTEGTYNNAFDLSLATSYNPSFLANAINMGSTATAEATLIGAMEGGHAYLNIHTDYRPSGEIRGYIARRVPDSSSTFALLIPGFLMAIGFTCRKRRLT
ncbi:MAG TPA: CHRD domain-containing protein, partial [Opitutus sp.]|nr:CHRD domain-containing protein [Opitutus sp.]